MLSSLERILQIFKIFKDAIKSSSLRKIYSTDKRNPLYIKDEVKKIYAADERQHQSAAVDTWKNSHWTKAMNKNLAREQFISLVEFSTP